MTKSRVDNVNSSSLIKTYLSFSGEMVNKINTLGMRHAR